MDTTNLRKAWGRTLVELGRENRDVVVLEADLGKSTRTCLFQDEFPERYFEMGIAEANMASTAAGLALAGKIPFVNSFAVFAAGRAYDQIRQAISIPSLKVRICGSSAGLSDFGDGATHQSVEDVAIMRAIPNMTVLVPADAVETRLMIRATLHHSGPVYFRINRHDLPVYTPEDGSYRYGEWPVIREGTDFAVIANGTMLGKAMEAAERLAAEGVSVRVVNAGMVKPLPLDSLHRAVAGVRGAVVAEEHSIIGGLGSAVAEALAGRAGMPLEFVAIRDVFGTSAENYEELLAHYGLTAEAIAGAVRRVG